MHLRFSTCLIPLWVVRALDLQGYDGEMKMGLSLKMETKAFNGLSRWCLAVCALWCEGCSTLVACAASERCLFRNWENTQVRPDAASKATNRMRPNVARRPRMLRRDGRCVQCKFSNRHFKCWVTGFSAICYWPDHFIRGKHIQVWNIIWL